METLRRGLRHPSPLLFLLADTRALTPEDAAERNREIARNLDGALGAEGLQRRDLLLVSRGDSTLRGHGVLEPDTLEQAFGPFDATLHVPAFLEGGRTTVNGVHLLHGEPVHTTPFAQDRLFGFNSSDLAAWLEEKSNGAIRRADVQRISGRELDAASGAGLLPLIERLRTCRGNRPVVVDAQRQQQLTALAAAVRVLQAEKRFLFRSAASMVKALADPGPPPLDSAGLAMLRRRDSAGRPLPGLVMVGSHVPLADQQLERLLGDALCWPGAAGASHRPGVGGTDTRSAAGGSGAGLAPAAAGFPRLASPRCCSPAAVNCAAPQSGRAGACLRFGGLMGQLAAALAPDLGYLISKGAPTQTLLARGLLSSQFSWRASCCRDCRWRALQKDPQRIADLTFPGNLGEVGTCGRPGTDGDRLTPPTIPWGVAPGLDRQVAPQLQGATDVGAGHPFSAGAAEVIGFDPPQFGGFLQLHQVVDAGTAAADPASVASRS